MEINTGNYRSTPIDHVTHEQSTPATKKPTTVTVEDSEVAVQSRTGGVLQHDRSAWENSFFNTARPTIAYHNTDGPRSKVQGYNNTDVPPMA